MTTQDNPALESFVSYMRKRASREVTLSEAAVEQLGGVDQVRTHFEVTPVDDSSFRLRLVRP